MKIKINREIDIPDGFICAGRRDCPALNKENANAVKGVPARCENFNDLVFWPLNTGARFFVKCRTCIEATLDHLNGVTK